jgi:hypothetical protein
MHHGAQSAPHKTELQAIGRSSPPLYEFFANQSTQGLAPLAPRHIDHPPTDKHFDAT